MSRLCQLIFVRTPPQKTINEPCDSESVFKVDRYQGLKQKEAGCQGPQDVHGISLFLILLTINSALVFFCLLASILVYLRVFIHRVVFVLTVAIYSAKNNGHCVNAEGLRIEML